ncbi:hypothetical protein KGM_206904 [Danaus plexippus plexippus]|uniref:Uncharacterized protein n=1 Tax=Danaus plexippus plexippus TaxID=278856 RepID=A0A212FMN9_DANPL|nr:hypothetical protein KGM_206904 [Danaus plexippus plexippus]
MEFALLFLALALFWKPSSGLHCFKCAPEETYSGDQQCSHFDGSDKFLVLCEHSTMCFKRETTLRLANGTHVNVLAENVSGHQETGARGLEADD